LKSRVLKTDEFLEWFYQQTNITKRMIDARLDRISLEGHLGFVNRFDGLIELKWTSGMRIYTFIYDQKLIIALHGGNKNGQEKDIQKAKKIKSAWLYRTHPEFK
jgi:putative addiction module killer protein